MKLLCVHQGSAAQFEQGQPFSAGHSLEIKDSWRGGSGPPGLRPQKQQRLSGGAQGDNAVHCGDESRPQTPSWSMQALGQTVESSFSSKIHVTPTSGVSEKLVQQQQQREHDGQSGPSGCSRETVPTTQRRCPGRMKEKK